MEKTLVYQPSVYRLTILYRVFSTHVRTLGSYCNHPVNTTYRSFRFTVCVAVFEFLFSRQLHIGNLMFCSAQVSQRIWFLDNRS